MGRERNEGVTAEGAVSSTTTFTKRYRWWMVLLEEIRRRCPQRHGREALWRRRAENGKVEYPRAVVGGTNGTDLETVESPEGEETEDEETGSASFQD